MIKETKRAVFVATKTALFVSLKQIKLFENENNFILMYKLHYCLGIMLLTTSLNLSAQVGDLDPSFGSNGFSKVEFDNGDDLGLALALQTDGKILQAGTTFNGLDYDFGVVRYLSDGSLDGTFGFGGKLSLDIGGESDFLEDMILQPDGKILACGSYKAGNQYDFVLARLTSSGSPDPGFGENGFVKLALDSMRWESGRALALQDDGKILVTGYKVKSNGSDQDVIVLRFYEDGSLDESFGDGGLLVLPLGNGHEIGSAITIQPDGKILVAGETDIGSDIFAFVLLRLLPDGQLDSSFGDSGWVSAKIGSQSFGYAIALQSDGKILVGGESRNNSKADFALACFLPDGSLDPDFGDSGVLISSIGGGDDVLYDLALQPDGKILGVGFAETGSVFHFALVRYLKEGQLDSSFGDGGMAISALGPSINLGYAVALQPDQRILVGGSVSFDFAVARYLGDLDVGLLNLSSGDSPALIYPNPIAGKAQLDFTLDKEETLSIELFDQQGRLIYVFFENQVFGKGKHVENLLFPHDLASGQYLVRLSSPRGGISIQVFVAR
jgi:uncharacterized delta-60 repeat protein